MAVTAGQVIIICAISLLGFTGATQTIGKIENCPKSSSWKTGVDIHATWSPFALKPNTLYTVNASITVHQDIDEVYESATIWIPEKHDPIYSFPKRHTRCSESSVVDALKFVNVTCPISKGTHRAITNFEHFLPGSEAAITGNFIVEAYLEDSKGKELGCWRANVEIAN